MRFSIGLAYSPPEHYVPIAKAADEAGYHAIAVSDHVINLEELKTPYPYTADGSRRWEPFTPWPDPWVSIGAMAAATERLSFFTNVYVLPMRNPFHVAKAVGTAAAISGNRVALGIGMGWCEEEFDLMEQPFRKRGKRADEMLEVMRKVWTGEMVEHHGEFYDFPKLEMNPPLTAPVPVYVGGTQRRRAQAGRPQRRLDLRPRHHRGARRLPQAHRRPPRRVRALRRALRHGRVGQRRRSTSTPTARWRTSASPTCSRCRGSSTAASPRTCRRRSTASTGSPRRSSPTSSLKKETCEVEKIIHALWRDPGADPATIEKTLIGDVAPALLDLGVHGLRVLTEEPAAKAMRFGANDDGGLLTASVGVWVDSIDEHQPVLDALAAAGCTTHAFLVTESVPLAYADRSWPEGTRSPGVALLTLFHKRDGLSDEEFYANWHGVQTPLSFELHPITLYMRNSIARALTPGAPAFRGIVEETVATLEDLLDFDRFYSAGGDADELRRRMEHSMEVHDSFTDMATLQMVPCNEVLFRVVST